MQYSPDGFDGVPEEGEVTPGHPLFVYRVHGSSRRIGRFFFAPQVNGTPVMNWTADMLEMELNAALWDNDFRHLAKFRVLDRVRYKYGLIAQDSYWGYDGTPSGNGLPFVQFAFFRNRNLFYQILINDISDSNWRNYLEDLGDVPINPGRFFRADGRGHC